MSTRDQDPFDAIEQALQNIQIKHFEMAGMVDDYRAMIEDLRDRCDDAQEKLARALPGARYHVASTYVNETWRAIEGDLKRAFAPPREG
jgi:hypothetical protein